ncbi:hypothetical protein HOA80_07575 [archaeon]|nr:hypothetical protein [archaeon]
MKFEGVKAFGVYEFLSLIFMGVVFIFVFNKNFYYGTRSYIYLGIMVLAFLGYVLRKVLYPGMFNQEIHLDSTTLTLKDNNGNRRGNIDAIQEFGLIRFGKRGQGVFVKTKSKETKFLAKKPAKIISELKKTFLNKRYNVENMPRKFRLYFNTDKVEIYKVRKIKNENSNVEYGSNKQTFQTRV